MAGWRCSFCGRTREEAAKLIAGPGVQICDTCVSRARSEHRPAAEEDTCSFCTKTGVALGWVHGTERLICKSCVELCSEISLSESFGGAAMLDRYDDDAREVLFHAHDEARALGHDYIGTEHLLLGLLAGDGPAARALGVEAGMVRDRVVEIDGSGAVPAAARPALTPRTLHVLERAIEHAKHARREQVAAEDLLIALIDEGEGVAVQALTMLGIDLGPVRDRLAPEDPPSVRGGPEPACPGCGARLLDSAAWRELDVPEHEGPGRRRVLFLFCLACGLTIDDEILPTQT